MAKLTLLGLTQKILSSMDSDEVNSISDTEEALQVVDIIEDTYFELMSQRDWPHLHQTCQLESVGSTATPTTLKIPTLVAVIEKLKYDTTEAGGTRKTYSDIIYKEPIAFVDDLLSRDSSTTEIDIVQNGGGTDLFIFNERTPRIWTSFDDENIVMDAYDKDLESTLQGNKTIVFCETSPAFNKLDTFVPDLPEKAFPLLLSESKRASHIYLKQADSPVDARNATRMRNRLQNEGGRAVNAKKTINFGRR